MTKNINLFAGCLPLFLVASGCYNTEKLPAPDPEWAPVAVVEWTDANKSFYNIEDIESAEFEYSLYGEDFGYPECEVVAIDVYLAMNGQGKKLFETYTSFPAMVNLPAAQAAAEFGLETEDLKVGDVFTFSYVVKSIDGRVFDLYGSNICNLIRIEGICHLNAYVLTPSIPLATVPAATSSFSMADIDESGDDTFAFDFDKRDFVSVSLSDVMVELALTDSEGTTDFELVKTVPAASIPSVISITASEAAAIFGKTAGELEEGDSFTVRFTFETDKASFSNYGSALCGVNFPGSIVHPFHHGTTGEIPNLGFENPMGTSTAPPSTTTSGTCSLVIPVTI